MRVWGFGALVVWVFRGFGALGVICSGLGSTQEKRNGTQGKRSALQQQSSKTVRFFFFKKLEKIEKIFKKTKNLRKAYVKLM